MKTRKLTNYELWKVQPYEIREYPSFPALNTRMGKGVILLALGMLIGIITSVLDINPYWVSICLPFTGAGVYCMVSSPPPAHKPMKGISAVITFEDDSLDWDGKKGKELEAIKNKGKVVKDE
jgi:hypothetical protein